MAPRRIPRSIYEEARDVARALAKTKAFEQSRRDRKRVEMLFAHLKRILLLAACDCAGRAVPSSSSRWRRSHRTFVGSQSWSHGHPRSHQPRAWRELGGVRSVLIESKIVSCAA